MAKSSILDPKAKAAKQKKQAVVLGVLFLALLAFSVPKTMKMLKSTPPPQAAPATTTTTTPTPATPTAPAPSTGVAQPVSASTTGADALVVNADLAPAPLEGQFALMTSFETKDPFRQQDSAEPTTPTPAGDEVAPESGGKTGGTPGKGGTTPTPGVSGGDSGDSGDAGGSGTTSPVATPTAATLSVNGVEEVVTVKADFPAASPLFHLVALTAKTAKISVAGGSLATGAPTVTLKLGKPLTLMNTADGTRYVVILVNTDPEAAAAPATSPAAPAATTPAP